MIVIIGYYSGDREQAVKLLGWMAELGQYPNHDLLFVRDHRAEALVCPAVFKSVNEIVIRHAPNAAWPIPHNTMFEQAARYIEAGLKCPWLWLEPDAVPIKSGWLDDIEKEYQSCGKPFMGDRVEVNNVPVHMSGVGVYPGQLSWNAGTALQATDIAWDVYAAPQIVPKMHDTKLILHNWKHEPFKEQGELDNLLTQNPECVLFHSDKSGTMIDLLKQKRGVPIRAAGDARAQSNSEGSIPSIPVCDIFIKTYPPDYEWMGFCRRSIDNFVTGFRKVILVIPPQPIGSADSIGLYVQNIVDDFTPSNHRVPIEVVEKPEFGEDGYLSQQVFKLYADTISDADYILHIDSDTMFTKPVTPETFFMFGKPIWMMTPWAQTQTPWQPIIEKFLKRHVSFEFMRRSPQCIPRWLYADLRAFCEREHGMSMETYVMSQPLRSFSEFNALGAFAYEFHRDKFYWIDTRSIPEKEWPELVVDQRWSKGGLTPEIKAEWDKILSGGVESRHAGSDKLTSEPKGAWPKPSASGSSDPPAQNNSPKTDSLFRIKAMCSDGSTNYEIESAVREYVLRFPEDTSSEKHKYEHIAALKREFTSPLAKARIMRSLKAAPILK